MTRTNKSFIILFSIVLMLVNSCREEINFIPKPKGYFRIDFPEKKYQKAENHCNVKFEIPKYAYIIPKKSPQTDRCFENIIFPYYKASIYCTLIKLDTLANQHISTFQNIAYEHRIKSSGIYEKEYINYDKNVFGTTFDIQGDVACNYMFYLTDSTNYFFSGSLYFEVAPNYDSLQPVIEYLKSDIVHLVETFEWKKNDSIPE